jgi:uncharacterized protein YeaO (DUF488 family)
MTIFIVRLGTARAPDEGIRVGTVRRPPRGVPKAQYAARDFYDVWLPALSPSADLVAEAKSAATAAAWERFRRKFRSEMGQPDAARLLDLLAALSHGTNLSVGCYCEQEAHCHRGVLRELLTERGAKVS